MSTKPTVSIPFEVLPEGKSWPTGKAYRVKIVLRKTGESETEGQYEVIDATSMEASDKGQRHYLTEGGYMKL